MTTFEIVLLVAVGALAIGFLNQLRINFAVDGRIDMINGYLALLEKNYLDLAKRHNLLSDKHCKLDETYEWCKSHYTNEIKLLKARITKLEKKV